MKIKIDSKDLLTIAGEIQRNCDLLNYSEGADKDPDFSQYAMEIMSLAVDLQAIVVYKERQKLKGGKH